MAFDETVALPRVHIAVVIHCKSSGRGFCSEVEQAGTFILVVVEQGKCTNGYPLEALYQQVVFSLNQISRKVRTQWRWLITRPVGLLLVG